MLLESEIAEEKTVTGMKVETPDGWKAIKKVYKTIPLDVWCVVTSSKTLKCSGHHLLKTPVGCVEVCELSAGDIVETIDGFEVILCVYDTGEQEELYDITVDSEDGLFYSNGFISHNSTTFCTRQLLLTHLIPAYKSLYVVPHHKQLETYGARFGQMEMAFRIKSTVQNVYNKTYRNRSTVNMIHCGETSQAARGKSADECVSVTDRVTVLRGGKDTTIPLKDIKPGMMVKSFYQDEEGWGNFRYNKVEAYKDKGVQECFDIKTSDGIVTCTANHKLCAVVDNTSTPYKTDWIYTKDLEARGITQLVGYKGITDILGITPVGEKHVADIQVARDRNFIAGGVVAHNCVIDECVMRYTQLSVIGLDKTIPICYIPVGAKITGFNENNERTTVEITAKKCNGYRRCYRIRTESGKELVCTGNHRLRTDRGWMYTIVLAGRLFGYSSSCESGGAGRLPAYEKSYTGIPAGRYVGNAFVCKHCENCMQSRTVSARVQRLQEEVTDPARIEAGNETEPRLRRRAGSNDDTQSPGLVSAPRYVLHEDSSGKDESAEVCGSGVGRSADLGSCSMVDMRRRFFKLSKLSISDCHPLIFPGGDRPLDCVVSCEWGNWSAQNGSSQEGQNLFYHICRYGSFVCNSEPYSALCTSVYGLQGKYASFDVQASLHTLRQGVHADKTTVLYELEERDVCVSRPCMSAKASQYPQQKILRQPLTGCEEGAVAYKGKDGKAAANAAEICRKSPGGASPETQGPSQTSQGGPVYPKNGKETQGYDTCLSPYDLFLLRSGDVYNGMEAQADSTLVDWENSMFEQGMSAAAGTLQEEAPRILIETERGVEWDSVKSIEYAGVHEVWDITTTPHHTFFADGIGVHNCQSLDPEHVEDILYTLTDSQMPTKVFAGTALSIDTLLEAKWQESSMGMWHVRAMDGKNWLNMYDKDVLYKVCSNPQGPTCPYTGKLLKVTDGCFVHAYEDRYRDGRIGLHIPQCIIPDLAYNPIKWGAIYDKVKNTDFKKVLQECFGIAIAEGSREITSQDLQRMCVLPDTPEQLKQKCKDGFYRVVISGCDWGGSDYNPSTKTKTSYTVHCIIGLAPDNHIDILHYKRYSGMMYNEIAAHIIEDHNAYNGTALASDFGVGLAYNMELRKYIPIDRHFIIGYVGPKAAAVSVPKDAHLDNQLSVNRTEALTNVFRDAKCIAPQKICCRNWTEMKPFLEDWLNMFRVPTEDNTGRSTFKYIRAATKADDALHAFTFAYVLMKIFMGESLIHDPQLEQKIQAIMTAPSARMAETNFQREMFGDPVWCISG